MNRGQDYSSHRLGRLLARVEGLFFSPLRSPEQWLLVLLVSLLFVFAPVIGDDWQLNTTGLENSSLSI
jgi:hypothetical protein